MSTTAKGLDLAELRRIFRERQQKVIRTTIKGAALDIERMLIGYGIRREYEIKGRRVVFTWKPPGGTSRFGGGWDFVVGVEVGGRSVIYNCGVFHIRVERGCNQK